MRTHRNAIIHHSKIELEIIQDIDSHIIINDDITNFSDETMSFLNKGKKDEIDKKIKLFRDQITKIEFHFEEILEESVSYIEREISYFEYSEN